MKNGFGMARALLVASVLAGCDGALIAEMDSHAVTPALAVEPAVSETAASTTSERIARREPRAPRRGVVTAGDIDDGLNFAAFTRYRDKTARSNALPRANLQNPVRLRFTGPEGQPAPGVSFTLRRPGAEEPFHTGISGVDGHSNVFARTAGASGVELRAFENGQEILRQRVATGGDVTEIKVPAPSTWAPQFLDLVFVFDTTGSMGDELTWLTKEFAGIVRAAQRAAPKASLRFGLVAYRDKGDTYTVQNFGFTERQSQMQGWLRGLKAQGGGDYPEAADAALMAAAQLDWRRGRGERLVFHVADAPAHRSGALGYLRAAQIAAGAGVQVFGLGASGVGEEAEYLMRQAAVITGGRYLFLTDDSGVGHAHKDPSIACYRVTSLKSLLVRVLRAELTGQRQEAPAREVLRSVGNYRNGVCAQ